MRHLENPIEYGPDDGQDRLQEGRDETRTLTKVRVPTIPLYNQGSLTNHITAPSLYPAGLGDPREIAVMRGINPLIRSSRRALRDDRLDLAVVSGYLSTENQHARWKILYARKNPQTPSQEILAGRYADSAGSVAAVADPDVNLFHIDEIQSLSEDKNVTDDLLQLGDISQMSKLIHELVQYRANLGKIPRVEILPHTATSVHNLGRSINVVLTDPDGKPYCMGAGVDIVSPAQQVAYFETNGPKQFEALVEQDPLMQEYLRSFDITEVGEGLIESLKWVRRRLFNAMTGAGKFEFYRGEQGHFSVPLPNDQMPSRNHVRAQAAKFGYPA